MTTTYHLTPSFNSMYRDSLGNPAVNGKVYIWTDSSKTTPVTVYQDKTHLSAHTNPIILNASGVVANASGDPKPIYWPNYTVYVEVYDSDDNLIQTVGNYEPAIDDVPTPGTTEVDFTNYYLNPQFVFLKETSYLTADLPAATRTPIAWENWIFNRNNITSDVTISFEDFAVGQSVVPHNPKRFLRFNASTPGSSETYKDISFFLSDVTSFSGESMIFASYMKSSTSSTIELIIKQNFGTGGSPSTEVVTKIDNINLTSSWVQYSSTISIPSVSGKVIGTSGDYIEIVLRMPLDNIAQVDMINFQINRGVDLFEFDYKSYEQEKIRHASLLLPVPTDQDIYASLAWNGLGYYLNNRTGLVSLFLDASVPDGYLPLDGTTYKTTDNIGATNITYERLYDYWQTRFGDGNFFGVPTGGFAGNNLTTSSNIYNYLVIYSGNVTDWANVSTTFTITKNRDGGTQLFGVSERYENIILQDGTYISNMAVGAVTDINAGTTPFTVSVIQQGSGGALEISLINYSSPATLTGGEYFLISSASVDYYVWYRVAGAGADPAVAGRTGILVDLEGPAASLNSPYIKNHTEYALLNYESYTITYNNTISAGDYFTISNQTKTFAIWYEVDGVGTAPTGSFTTAKVSILSTDTNVDVASKTNLVINKLYFHVPDFRGYFIRLSQPEAIYSNPVDPQDLGRYRGSGSKLIDVTTDASYIGSTQDEEFLSHTHTETYYEVSAGSNYPGGSAAATAPNAIVGGATGGVETRPVNKYLLAGVKF